jgi:hypothetical protein
VGVGEDACATNERESAAAAVSPIPHMGSRGAASASC